ncbi:ABC transporter substrate-binding protein [Egbenema bharatensis]|uniref:ABC transporter substrate-binding protein n=1 Tax=Egbenema bharatensis TaxID=3463334 RepID=UPI003A855609
MNISSHRTRRQVLQLLTGTAGSLALNACVRAPRIAATSAASDLATFSFGFPLWTGNLPFFVAKEKGFFEEVGLSVNARDFDAIAEAFPAFNANQFQGIAPASSEVVSLFAEGSPGRLVTVMGISVGADVIMARNSVASVADFKGKQIAVQKGGIGHFFVLQALAEAGLSETDVTILNIDPITAAKAYEVGNVEIAYSYPPFSSGAIAAQPDGRIIYDSSTSTLVLADTYFVSTGAIENEPQTIEAFLTGIFKGVEFYNTNPDEAIAITARQLRMRPQEVREQLEVIRFPTLQMNMDMLTNPQSDRYLLDTLTVFANFLEEQKLIDAIPNLPELVEPRFVQALSDRA